MGWHFIGDAALGYRASDNPIINVQQMPMGAMWQMIFFFVCIEWLTAYVCTPPPGRPWDVLGWNYIIYDEEDKFWKERQLQEINNSRLAMVAILGLIGQTLATGNYGGWSASLASVSARTAIQSHGSGRAATRLRGPWVQLATRRSTQASLDMGTTSQLSHSSEKGEYN